MQLGIQRELPGGFVLEANYVGNRGTHIEIKRNLNVTPQRYLSTSPTFDKQQRDLSSQLKAFVANPFYRILPSNSKIGSSSAIAREALLRAFPEFDMVETTTNEGYSWYHSLQVRLDRRFSKGFTLNTSYTFSKFMQATELLNQDDPRPTRAISDADRPHRLIVSGIYELPFGRGRSLLGSSNSFVDKLFGGWQLSGIYSYQSGAPLLWGNIPFIGDPKTIALPSNQRTLAAWFNKNAGGFYKPGVVDANGKPVVLDPLDHNVRSFPLRFGFLRADNMNNIDLSIIKNTGITETRKLQFRADLLNAFNHPLFPAPSAANMNPTAGASFGAIISSTQDNYSRRVQLSAKFIF